jgi:NAD(P)-dependent dehydrogenase (short-subunit alcohol dehydrogenase family)
VITRNQSQAEIEKFERDYPLGRPGFPDDIARVVLFCASDLSAFMTGSTLRVEGGSSAGIFP